MPRRNARYTTQSLTGRCPPAWIQKTTAELLPALTSKAIATTFITDFVAVMANPRLALPNAYVALIQDANVGNVDVYDMLYWLDRGLKASKATLGYADRLSEAGAGWGEAEPDSLTEADPLDLVTTLEGLGCKVVIVDPNADPAGTNNTDVGSTVGFVHVTYNGSSDNPCRTVDGAAKDPSPNLFTTGTKDVYRYKGIVDLNSINETGGGSSCRFPNSAAPCFWLVRSADVHDFYAEAILRRPAAHTAPASITITGYPGELPIINAGSSLVDSGTPGVLDDVNYDSVGILADTSNPYTTARQNMILLGSGTERNNFHFRNIEWHGRRRLSDDSGWVYVSQLIEYTSLSSGSMRHCVFRHFQFIRPDDGYAGANPGLVDAPWASRTGNLLAITGVEAGCDDFVFDSNYVEPVTKAAWPSVAADKIDNHGTFDGAFLNIDGEDGRVTRNTFRGVKTNSMVVASAGAHRFYAAHNDMEVYDKTCIDVFSSDDVIVELNRLHDYGNADVALESGGDGVKINDCTRPTVRHNVIFNHETAIYQALGIAINAHDGTPTTDARVYGNIVYRGCIRVDAGGGANVVDADIYQNICAGITEARKGFDTFNAPINYEGTLAAGTLEGNLIRDNIVWRFTDADPTSDTIETGPHLSIRKTSGQNQFLASEETTGWTGNAAAKPAWAGDPEADDFRLSVDPIGLPGNMPFTEALSQAWEPE